MEGRYTEPCLTCRAGLVIRGFAPPLSPPFHRLFVGRLILPPPVLPIAPPLELKTVNLLLTFRTLTLPDKLPQVKLSFPNRSPKKNSPSPSPLTFYNHSLHVLAYRPDLIHSFFIVHLHTFYNPYFTTHTFITFSVHLARLFCTSTLIRFACSSYYVLSRLHSLGPLPAIEYINQHTTFNHSPALFNSS